jgi:hypothetical protein
MALSPVLVLLAAPLLWLAFPTLAEAQVDESLLTRRWRADNFWAETYDKPLLTAQGRLEETDERIQLFHWDSEGRIKFQRKDLNPPVWIGYRAFTMSVSSDSDMLDHTFSDVGLAVAVRLGMLDDQWTVHASAGAGTANDGRWDNRHALYPVATVDFSRPLGCGTLHVGLSLAGNREILPDYPLPVLQWEARIQSGLDVMIGFPKIDVVVRPFDPLFLSFEYAFPANAAARVEADLGSGFSVFGEISRQVDGFHLRHEEDLRLFFSLNAAELGFRWVTKYIDVSLSAGYAFGLRFFTGDDLSDRTRGVSVHNLPFIALTFPSTFWAAPFSSGLSR